MILNCYFQMQLFVKFDLAIQMILYTNSFPMPMPHATSLNITANK